MGSGAATPQRRTALFAALVVALALAVAGCGSSSSSSSTAASGAQSSSSTAGVQLAKTKFVLHAGLAFGAFHHFIYTPLRAGDLSHPFSHKLTIVKAGLAATFVVHELKLALADARADPTLSKLVAPLTDLDAKLSSLVAGITGGSPNAGGVESANSTIGSISGLAASAGQPITSQVPSTL